MVLDVPALNNLADAMQVLEEVRLTLSFGGFDENERRDLAYAMFNGALMVGARIRLFFRRNRPLILKIKFKATFLASARGFNRKKALRALTGLCLVCPLIEPVCTMEMLS